MKPHISMESQKEEFVKILSAYQGIIYKVSMAYFSAWADREDNFQEVAYQLWKSFPRLRDRSKIGSWIYAVAINTSISKVRSNARPAAPGIGLEAAQDDAVDRIERAIDSGRLVDAIQVLDEIDRAIMLLYLEDLTYEEIAGITGVASSNVGARISRAKDKLRQYLKE